VLDPAAPCFMLLPRLACCVSPAGGGCLQVIAVLESWAKPIKDAALRAIESNQASNGSQVSLVGVAAATCVNLSWGFVALGCCPTQPGPN